VPLHVDVQARGRGPRVVLVHGFTQTGRSWAGLVPRLAERHEVVCVDAPGHGRSAAEDVDLVRGAVLLADAGGEGAYVGYSMGGRLTLHLALARPDLVRRVVLVGATAGIDGDAERAQRRAADEALAHDLERDGLDAFLERWLANPLFATLPRGAAGVEDRRENTVAGLASSLRLAGTGAQAPLWDRLHEARMPALLVAGERDAKFRALAERLALGWGGSARVAVISDAGHACHLERPEEFADAVVAFLDEDQRTASPAASSSP
jgi:2-succinyl-6-hydroxy-2,4-cyclohexadiene-1-carboxylate synthase